MTPQTEARYRRLSKDVADLKKTLRDMEPHRWPAGAVACPRCCVHPCPPMAARCWSCVWEEPDENAAEETKEAIRNAI